MKKKNEPNSTILDDDNDKISEKIEFHDTAKQAELLRDNVKNTMRDDSVSTSRNTIVEKNQIRAQYSAVINSVVKKSTQDKEIAIKTYENVIENEFIQFVCKLYSNECVTKSLVQEIVTDFIDFTGKTLSAVADVLKASLPAEYENEIRFLQHFNILDNLNTEFKRLQFLENANMLIKPQPFEIGEKVTDKKRKRATVSTITKSYGYIVPMRYALKLFLELPNVYNVIINFMQSEIENNRNNEKIFTSLFQGERWIEISKQFIGKIVIPLFLYFDDFEINNPLSSAAGVYKIGGLYYSIASLPPKLASLLENIFLAQFIFSSDHKEFKNEKCFKYLIEELKFLANEGISITVDGEEKKVYFAVLGILGDNLGLNTIFGFMESFSSDYFCRICRASKFETVHMCKERKELLRNSENYAEDLKAHTSGIKSACVFNDLPYFDCTKNYICDAMHDLQLGIYRYDFASIIGYCIDKKYFTLKHFNNRLKYFSFTETDRGNKITAINEYHIKTGYLIRTAAEMSYLISYFGVLVGDLVPEDDLVWEFYHILFDINDLVYSSTLSEKDIKYLESLITTHNKLKLDLFHDLKPKDHILLHFCTVIRTLGPLKYLSCNKFEAYHKKSKKYAHIITSRVNIIYSLSVKLQLEYCFRLASKKGFNDSFEYGTTLGHIDCKTNFFQNGDAIEISYVKINGTLYRQRHILFFSVNESNDPLFVIIQNIIKDKFNNVYFVYKNCQTIGFNNHIKCYEISFIKNASISIHKFDANCYFRPMEAHTTSDGKLVISKRDLQ